MAPGASYTDPYVPRDIRAARLRGRPSLFELSLGLIGFIVVAIVASMFDPIGWGYLLSTHVGDVADARLAEALLGMPMLYFLAALLAGAGVVLGVPHTSVAVSWMAGLFVGTFALVTMWDLRRRRGTLAVYIRIRREEIGFEPKGSVIEVPKLMFLVMNQPTPLVWLLFAISLAALAVSLFPTESWVAVLPLALLSLIAVWVWLRHRNDPWERLARRLRRASPIGGPRLAACLAQALDLDPEVAMLRREAESVVARFVQGGR